MLCRLPFASGDTHDTEESRTKAKIAFVPTLSIPTSLSLCHSSGEGPANASQETCIQHA